MQKWVVICWALLALAGADECPDGGRCEEGQTCCKQPANGYECCPFDQAECCEDHIHCCPESTVCDMSTSSCVNATVSVPWAERASAGKPRVSKSFRMIKAYMGEEDDNICPDQSRCPPEFSCLRALTRFGCCPLAQGIPCSDGKHCCPEGLQCSADSRSCIRKEVATPVLCSDGVSECPDGTTCCETPEGKWGCCPMPKAVCCEDKLHCCPEGNTCDVEHSKCISSSTKKETPMWAKLPARTRAEWENQKESEQMVAEAAPNEGSEKAPEVTKANTLPPCEGEVSVSSVTKAPTGNDVPCNETVGCQGDTTCCKNQEGGWACCPLPEAVCCEDFIHCCPKGMICDVAAGGCKGDSCYMPWFEKMPTVPIQVAKAENVTCDSTHSCPDGTTCCKKTTGDWACCPLPDAVCCEDHEHCCPSGTTCDLATLSCVGSSGSTPMTQKIPAFTDAVPSTVAPSTTAQVQGAKAENVTCDSTHSCPDGTTCCKKTTGDWACCPLPDAVCCEDHEHCCPSGTTCDLATLSCVGSSGSTPMTQKIPAFTDAVPSTTAQKQGTVTTQTVEEMEERMEEGMEAQETDLEEEGKEVQCDDRTSCPQGTTCCFMKSSRKWGCCPLPEAVCCADGDHCCPAHYKCNERNTSCVKEGVVIPWYTKIPATVNAQADPSSVPCDDQNQCPEYTSCCRLSTGEWGCCPIESAVCCPDKKHCCPPGYSCNIAAQSCHKVIMLQLDTIPLTPVFLSSESQLSPLKHSDVKCDDKTSCQDGETCCKMSATTWGCCPLPNAVCCSDMLHCCQTGYTCTDTGDCLKDTRRNWHNWHMFLGNKKRALNL